MRIRKSTALDAVILVGLMAALFFMAWQADAQQVTYCKDARTGEIIVIQEGYPCPSPTHQI